MGKQAFMNDLAEVMEIDAAEINDTYLLDESNNWDSLIRVSAIAIIDEHFQLSLEYRDLRDVKCVGDLLKLIEQKRSGQTQSA